MLSPSNTPRSLSRQNSIVSDDEEDGSPLTSTSATSARYPIGRYPIPRSPVSRRRRPKNFPTSQPDSQKPIDFQKIYEKILQSKENLNQQQISNQEQNQDTSSGNLEDDPYYKKLMGCSCAKTSDAKGVPTISRTGKGPSNGKPPTSLNGEGNPSRVRAVSDSNMQTRYTIRRGTNYVDNGNNIRGANGENYNNRCFIISLADILGYKTNAEYLQFYENIVTEFNAYYAKLPEAKKNVDGLKQLNSDLQMVANRQGPEGYIDAADFFKFFQICDLNRTGIIYSQPIEGGVLTFNSSGAVQQMGRDFTNGFYIPPLNQDGTLGEITVNTPIIYNQGLSHFVTGIGKIDENMLNDIKRNGPYLITYTDSEIKIPNKDGNCIPKLTEEQKVKLYNSLNATSNCKFKMGDYIIYDNIEYIVLEARGNDKNECGSYIVCTSHGVVPVVSIITNIANIKSSQKPTLPIDAVLARVHSSGKYPEIVQAADKTTGTLINDITIPGAIVSSLAEPQQNQSAGNRTRKHRRSRKTLRKRKTIKKRKITKKRKTIRK